MVQWAYLVMEAVYFTLGTLSMTRTLKNWKENKNRILIAISVYIIAVLARSLIDIIIYITGFTLDAVLAGTLTVGQVIGNILFVIQLEFMFFLKKYPKLYSLPVIIAFYLIIGRILVDSAIPFIIYAMLVSYSSAYFLIRDGKRRHNGLAIGMGLFFLIWGLGQTIGPNTEWIFITFRLIAMVTLYAGTRGFYEKYVWPNQEKEQKIMNAWITKLVAKK
ncbi:MAG: hypothetical protein ACFFCI_05730 [Promethearchaeota archaeon]